MRMLDTNDVAEALKVNPKTARKLMYQMKVVNISCGGRPNYRVSEEELARFLHDRAVQKVVPDKPLHRKRPLPTEASGLDENGHLIRRPYR